MTRTSRTSSNITDYVEWEEFVRLDEDGDDCGLTVRVYYEASSYVPYSRATYYQPAEGGYYEDIIFVRAEVDPRQNAAPLTDDEVKAVVAWFNSEKGQESAQSAALRALEEYDRYGDY